MDYRNDWDKSRERFSAFLQGELLDRCCSSIIAPREGRKKIANEIPQNPEDKVRYWTDGEVILKRYRKYFDNTYFGGEAFPQIWLNLGAAGSAGFFKGVRYQFEDTVWFFPFINNWEEDILEFDDNSFLYRKTIELAKYFCSESKGSYMVSMPDISGIADSLAHMRGSENLMIDMLTEKEHVHKAFDTVLRAWTRVTGEVYDIVKDNNDGGSCIGWLHTWGKGRLDQIQCDMSVMLSPQLFEEFIVPELVAQTDILDNSVYHFDGYEQVKHLDMLLSIRKLTVIQWNDVEGQPSPLQFLPELKKIQKSGKSLLVSVKPTEVEPIMTQLSSKGLYLIVYSASEEEGRYVLKLIEKLTHE